VARFKASFNFGANAKPSPKRAAKRPSASSKGTKSNAWTAYAAGGRRGGGRTPANFTIPD
jgi:hypothetical protein